MTNFSEFFDAYSLRARLRPSLLVLFPALTSASLLFPTVYSSAGAVVASLAASSGALVLFANLGRHLGRKKEIQLYAAWGGMPTVAWLRHRDTNLDPITKERYHRFLEKHIGGLVMPTAQAEQADPEAADKYYWSATKWLIEFTRDKAKYSLLFEELVNYGFQRNLLGLKPLALGVILASIALTVGVGYQRHGWGFNTVNTELVVSFGVSIAALAVWLLVVTSSWVRDAADAYARTLLAACEARSQPG